MVALLRGIWTCGTAEICMADLVSPTTLPPGVSYLLGKPGSTATRSLFNTAEVLWRIPMKG
ncbi:hypothetical protein ACP70R_047828 [Stipagrostis hirtigluma subsp. patula]